MSVADVEISEVGALPIAKSPIVDTTVQTHARAIFAEFGKVVGNGTTRAVIDIAMSGVSCDMYDRIEQAAIEMAKLADKTSGFEAASDAKGAAKYGPRQASMRVQASMRRQLFGAARLNLGAVVSIPASGIVNPDTYPGFVQAVNLARAYLKDKGVDWTGRAVDDLRRDRETKKQTATWKQARDMAEAQNPMQAGETLQMWQTRVMEAVPDIEASLIDEARAKELTKRAKALFEEFGVLGTADLIAALQQQVDNSAKAQPASM